MEFLPIGRQASIPARREAGLPAGRQVSLRMTAEFTVDGILH